MEIKNEGLLNGTTHGLDRNVIYTIDDVKSFVNNQYSRVLNFIISIENERNLNEARKDKLTLAEAIEIAENDFLSENDISDFLKRIEADEILIEEAEEIRADKLFDLNMNLETLLALKVKLNANQELINKAQDDGDNHTVGMLTCDTSYLDEKRKYTIEDVETFVNNQYLKILFDVRLNINKWTSQQALDKVEGEMEERNDITRFLDNIDANRDLIDEAINIKWIKYRDLEHVIAELYKEND